MSFPTLGLQRGGGLGRAPVRGSANIASGRAHAPETAKGSRHGPTRVSGVRGSERRSDRRKAYLPYGLRLSVVSGRSPRTTVKCHVCYYFTFYHSLFFIYTVCSTTLWVGQVDKKATQQDLTNLFEEFGQIESINVRSLSGPIRHYNSNVVLLT